MRSISPGITNPNFEESWGKTLIAFGMPRAFAFDAVSFSRSRFWIVRYLFNA
jgi:hypothetical protein